MSAFVPHSFSTFTVVPLTYDNRLTFFDLLQEQAETHGATMPLERRDECALKLHDDVHSGHFNAFLVYDREIQKPVTTATFFDCQTQIGKGIYLDDLVTTAAQRRKGHGSFALCTLAQIALTRGARMIRWECAEHNAGAQRFYDELGGERLPSRVTWRRNRHAASFAENASLVTAQSEGITSLSNGTGREYARLCHYRSYSTFQMQCGLHVESVELTEDKPHFMAKALSAFGAANAELCRGYFDVTLTARQNELYAKTMREMGFAPLRYDKDDMIVRVLRDDALSALAKRPGRALIGGGMHEKTGSERNNRTMEATL